jgi:diguanylate cyclase (GGDEF)-like protein
MVSASIGSASLWLAGMAARPELEAIWLTWWMGDAVGCITVAPLLLLWAGNPRITWTRAQWAEALLVIAGLALSALVVFGGLAPWPATHYPLEFICTPFIIWAAYRFGHREAATALLVLSAIALVGTLRGYGPFSGLSPNESLLLLQLYMGVTAVVGLILGAVVTERQQVESRLRVASITDSLTGLPNYRHLMSVLDFEITRSRRTARPFAVIFLDVDGLKAINDTHGHIVGSRALCRVGEALRASRRTIDTAARYGGDEFILILPETDREGAAHVAARIRACLADDGQAPAVSVTVGVASYPADGSTADELLHAADQVLYNGKGQRPPAGERVRHRDEPIHSEPAAWADLPMKTPRLPRPGLSGARPTA